MRAVLNDAPAARGWVLDLCGNDGGSIVPMSASVGPFLGAGSWVQYRRRDGTHLAYHYAAGEVCSNVSRRASGNNTVGAREKDLSNVPGQLVSVAPARVLYRAVVRHRIGAVP
jgi:hypothetical protein